MIASGNAFSQASTRGVTATNRIRKKPEMRVR